MSSENDPSPPQPTHLPCSFLPQVRQYLGARKCSRSSTTSYLCHPQCFVQSADPCLGQGRGGAWDHRRACKTAVCPPSNPSNPSAGLSKATLAASRRPFQGNSRSFSQVFPRQLSQLPAGLSKATLAATGPRQCFKPFRRPFQGNSQLHAPAICF